MRLTTKVIYTLFGFLILLMGTAGVVSIKKEQQVLRQLLTEHGEATANTIAAVCIESILSEDYPVIDTFLSTTGQTHRNIILLEVFHNNQSVSRFQRTRDALDFPVEFNADILIPENIAGTTVKLGNVRLVLSDRINRDFISSRIEELAWYTVFTFAITFLGMAVMLRKTVLERIQQLTLHSNAIGQGDLTTRLEFTSGDELDDLAGSLNDMSENIRRSHNEIRQNNIELEKKARALEETTKAAQSANRAKSEFLANMSHEIRTPLTAILGFNELLSTLETTPKQQYYIESTKIAGEGLLTIINDILDLSKIEADLLVLEFEFVNLSDIIYDVMPMVEPQCHEKKLTTAIEFAPDLPGSFLLDKFRLRQVLLNLVGNAVKFTEKGHIAIRAEFTRKSGANACDLTINVEDTGVGIPPDQQELIFEAFRQRDGQKNRQFGGTGLGLTICRRLVEMMNGKIALTSRVGQGTTFTVTLSDVAVSDTQDSITDAGDSPGTGKNRFPPTSSLTSDENELNRNLYKNSTIQLFSETHVVGMNLPLQELLDKLEKEYTPVIESFQGALEVDSVNSFANGLALLANEYDSHSIRDYAEQLNTAVDHFDILKIQKLMEVFPVLINTLKDSINGTDD